MQAHGGESGLPQMLVRLWCVIRCEARAARQGGQRPSHPETTLGTKPNAQRAFQPRLLFLQSLCFLSSGQCQVTPVLAVVIVVPKCRSQKLVVRLEPHHGIREFLVQL